jgi:hypothetical protein
MSTTRERELALKMRDLLTDHPEGVDRDDLIYECEIRDVGEFHAVKGVLQDMFAPTDTVTIVGQQTGSGGWRYYLLGDPGHPVSVDYVLQGLIGMRGRELRKYAVTVALARRAGSGSAARLARAVARSTYRSIEDLDDLLESYGRTPSPPLVKLL